MDVRLRAAPSPTGRAQLGNVRTYFMSYAYAKKNKGRFIFRIEDTDEKRTVPGGAEALIEAYEAFGIVADEDPYKGGPFGPYVQTERKEIYGKYAKELIEKGDAYYCFCSQERLAKLREEQKASKQRPMYDRACRNLAKEDVEKRIEKGEKPVIRMKFPTEGETICHDLIFGEVKFQNSDVEDQVILKADGMPTYHLAVVVDDHLMKISTAVRGTEWFPSFPKHVKLYEYFEWEMPEFVHVPVILNPDGKGKLSKRNGAIPAISYLRKGYLKDAVLNYTMLCGWAPTENEAHHDEIYSAEELIQLFDFKRCHKTGARYDQKKFDYINSKHIRNKTIDELANIIIAWARDYVLKPFLTDKFDKPQEWEKDLKEKVSKYLPLWEKDREYFKKALSLEQERVNILSEIPDALDFFYDEDLTWEESDWNTKNHSKKELSDVLEKILPRLEEIFKDDKFEHEIWEKVVRGFAEEIGWKAGDVFLAIRSATTGRLQSPPLIESFQILGWKRVKKSIEDGITWLKNN
ncbi:glutamate--tRNA ligase [Candidatus Dojkabacteria bacterium]|jgi:glutamyl-tRNA synthetase|nr:glutamate--tRNA ligase [Candidatus Dojkabacteria bacterium]